LRCDDIDWSFRWRFYTTPSPTDNTPKRDILTSSLNLNKLNYPVCNPTIRLWFSYSFQNSTKNLHSSFWKATSKHAKCSLPWTR